MLLAQRLPSFISECGFGGIRKSAPMRRLVCSIGSRIMPVIRFDGRVLPAAIQVSVQDHPSINWKDAEEDLDIKFTISIRNGIVSVECEVEKFDQDVHMVRIFMRAFDLARATVDLVAFNSGYGLTVVFDTFTSPSGVTSPFVSHDPRLVPLCTAFRLGEQATDLATNNFHQTLLIVALDWRVAHALRGLIEAITLPHESAVNCARSIEGLKNIIAVPGLSKGQAWKAMREALNLSEPYLKLITDVSTGPRHGDHSHVPGTITVEITQRSWVIMNRFLEYKKRGSQPLALADFPILTA